MLPINCKSLTLKRASSFDDSIMIFFIMWETAWLRWSSLFLNNVFVFNFNKIWYSTGCLFSESPRATSFCNFAYQSKSIRWNTNHWHSQSELVSEKQEKHVFCICFLSWCKRKIPTTNIIILMILAKKKNQTKSLIKDLTLFLWFINVHKFKRKKKLFFFLFVALPKPRNEDEC